MNITETARRTLMDMTSKESLDLAHFVLGAMVQPPVFLLGVIANIINIIIYLKLRLKDSLSICFFVLSCSDLMCVVLLIMDATTVSFKEITLDRFVVDAQGLTWLIALYYGAFYDISQGITTFIAVQKCWCVALPLRFKNTFTTTRTSFILTAISLMFFTLYIPVFSVVGLQEELDTLTNKTLLKIWTSETMGPVFSAVGLLALVFTTTCQVTVISCLVVLASSLRASTRFRNSTKLGNTEPRSGLQSGSTKCDKLDSNLDGLHGSMNVMKHMNLDGLHGSMNVMKHVSESNEEIPVNCDINIVPKNSPLNYATSHVKKTSSKELQAIKSTTCVAILFVSCNSFKLINYYVILCIPEYMMNGLYANTYHLVNAIRVSVETFHVSCNVFVYLTFNTRFRVMLLSMFRGGNKLNMK